MLYQDVIQCRRSLVIASVVLQDEQDGRRTVDGWTDVADSWTMQT